MNVSVRPVVIGALGMVIKILMKVLEDLEKWGRIDIDQNSLKIPGDLRRLAITQTLVEGNQLMLQWKIHMK